jgi:hypothetical protein
MSLLRWLPTFLAFPLGGFLSLLVFGSSASPLAALGGGVIVGAAIGAAQWLALGRVAGWRWFAVTTIVVAVGNLVAWLLIGPPSTMPAAALTGLIVGALVGVAEALTLTMRPLARLAWAVTVALSWALGWAITALVIVDLDRGHFIFGSSGAIVATMITGVVLRSLLGRRVRPQGQSAPVSASVTEKQGV